GGAPPTEAADEDLYEGKTVFIEDVTARPLVEEKPDEFSLTEMIQTPAARDFDESGADEGIFGQTVMLPTSPADEEPEPPAEEPAAASDTAAWASPPLAETGSLLPPPPPAEPAPPLLTERQEPVDLLSDEPFAVTAEEGIPPEPPSATPTTGYPPAADYAPATAEYAAPPAKSGKKTILIVGIIAAVVIIGLLAVVGYFAIQLLTPDKSTLAIKSYPEEAVVYLNGDEYGSTPFRHENIDPGNYTLELRKEGFAVLSKSITLEAGQILELRERLTRLGEPEPTEPLDQFTDELVELQAKADDAFQRDRLLEPPEDNAYYFTQQMLALDETNEYALDLQTQIVDTWKSKAEAALKAGNFYNAKKFYTQLLELQPENEEFKQAVAQSEEKLQEFFSKKRQNLKQFQSRAEKLIWQGDLITPADENAYEICLQIRAMDRNNDFATKTMRDIRRKADNQIDNAILESKWARAQELLEAFNKYFPGDAAAFQKLEKVKEKLVQARIDAQQQAREKDREQQLEKARQTSQQGISAYKSGNYGNAIDLLQQALQLNPDLSDAYFYLGASYLEMRDFSKARQYFQKTIEKDSNHKMAYLNLGILSQESKNYDRAIECLNKVILLGGAPNYPVSRLRETVDELNIRKGFASLINQPLAAQHKKFLGSADGYVNFSEDHFRFETSEAKKGFDFPLNTMDNLKFSKGTEMEFTAGGKKYTVEIKNTADYERLRRFLPDYLRLVK
ncbi:MAG: tetratricopeptide repeat protein, partial [Acidobacteria bacterium]|nr:tetratricopeptide repeat protein [Acidobacteriota bacterium]